MSPMVHCFSFCNSARRFSKPVVQFVEVRFGLRDIPFEARDGRAFLLPADQLGQLQVLAMDQLAQ